MKPNHTPNEYKLNVHKIVVPRKGGITTCTCSYQGVVVCSVCTGTHHNSLLVRNSGNLAMLRYQGL